VAAISAPFDVNLTVIGQENEKVDIVFNLPRLTDEPMKSDSAFPPYVKPQQKMRMMVDASMAMVRYVEAL
jgi:hypothetical protein